MIPLAYIQAWRAYAPWPDLRQVEQHLIICRALCDLSSAPALEGKLAFRGGTAMHKLLFKQPLRYSEDIADAIAAKLGELKGNRDAIAETIENNVRSKIVKEHLNDPAFYERMSALLDGIIKLRKERAEEYEQYLLRIAQLVKDVEAGRAEDADRADYGKRSANTC